MNAKELFDILEQLDEDELENMEVRYAHQKGYALEYSVADAKVVDTEGMFALYIVEGKQYGYLPEDVNQEIGWD